MVHLSRKPFDKSKRIKLYQLLFEITSSTRDKDEFIEVVKDILSPSEQIMVVKRIAIIYLLMKDFDQAVIAEYLGVSRATVAKFCLLFTEKDSRLIAIITSILRKEKISHFFEDLFADLFIQPGVKIGHWKHYWQHKQRQEERKMIDV